MHFKLLTNNEKYKGEKSRNDNHDLKYRCILRVMSL